MKQELYLKKVGDSVTQGDLIAKVYSQEILSEKMLTEFEKNVIMGSECKETTEILKNNSATSLKSNSNQGVCLCLLIAILTIPY